MDRRTFGAALGGLAAAAAVSRGDAQPTAKEEKSFHLGMVMFDQMTNLDLVGPLDMFGRVPQVKVHLLGKSMAPIETDTGMRVLPQARLSDAPKLDMLFVPGGTGTTQAMEDPVLLDWLRSRAPEARWVTSVCTGALVLGAAGLLKGHRAATHWTVMDLLPLLGAQPVERRVVIDRNRITGGGVTAGIDFALTVIARLWGEEQAELLQLMDEYDPAPPFRAGSPASAPDKVVDRYRTMSADMSAARRAAAERAQRRMA
jgi:cyclohexyl-isocyanide hydratase